MTDSVSRSLLHFPGSRSLVCLVLLVGACDPVASDLSDAGADAWREPPDAWIVPIEAPPLAADNALESTDPRYPGQLRFLHDTWGAEVLDAWPPADFMLGLMRDEPAVFGNQFESFGFVPDPDDDFPVGFKRGIVDSTRVHETCALCHVGELPDGRLWIGAPNTRLDIGRFRVEVDARWVAAGNPSRLTDIERSKALQLGPGRFNAESGSYPQVVPADFPPYFDLGERTTLNYLGTGGDVRTEAHMALFAFGPGDSRIEPEIPFPTRPRIDELIAFMAAIPAPAPPSIDAALALRGEAIFTRERCGECHHVDDLSLDAVVTYDRAVDGMERYPGDDPSFARGSIRTSYWHRVLIDGDPDAGPGGMMDDRTDLIRFIIRNGLRVAISDGYRAATLRGLWATAPYLHNGSVPTLDDLLRPPSERPTSFMRGDFVVDTTVVGSGNEGHTFGTTLSDEDRGALVAYLLSL